MRALVFGRSGQLATELARRMPEAECLGRAEADLSDPAACAGAIRAREGAIGAVINAAAWTRVDAAEAEEAAARIVNAEAPAAMAAACAGLGLPFLHVSTDYVFPGTGARPWAEGDAPAPLGAYGRTKRAGEEAVIAAMEGAGPMRAPWAILRTSWVFSAHGSNFVRTMLRLGGEHARGERDGLRVVGDQIGGPTPAAGIADALARLARRLALDAAAPSGLYHYAGAPAVSWAEFARAILEGAGLDVPVTAIRSSEYPAPAPRPANSRLSGARLLAEHGIAPPDWRAGLADVLGELRARGEIAGAPPPPPAPEGRRP